MADFSGGSNYFEICLKKGHSHLSIIISDAICISWEPGIILSPKIIFDGKPDVRGGVPVVLSTYAPLEVGAYDCIKHNCWEVKDGFNPNSDSITLLMQENNDIRNAWNYKFKIELTILLLNETQLKLDVVITNTGNENFLFSCSLYSYFTVTDVVNDKMSGLSGCTYIQREKDGKSMEKTRQEDLETGKKIRLSELCNRIYKNTPSGLKIEKLSSNRSVKLEKCNLPDIVLYNPHGESLSRSDSERNEEVCDTIKRNTICVEAGTVDALVALEANKSYTAHLIVSVE